MKLIQVIADHLVDPHDMVDTGSGAKPEKNPFPHLAYEVDTYETLHPMQALQKHWPTLVFKEAHVYRSGAHY